MISEHLKTFVAAVAAIAAVFLFGGSRAEAAIEIVASVPGAIDGVSSPTTDVFYSSSSNFAQTPVYTIGGYNFQLDTSITNFSGTSSRGVISTTVDIFSTAAGGVAGPLTLSIMIIHNVPALDGPPPTTGTGPLTGGSLAAVEASSLLPWTAPAGSPVLVTANTSTSSQASYSGSDGTAVTKSYYDSPPIAGTPRTTETGGPTPGSPVISSLVMSLVTGLPTGPQSVTEANAGTYTLSQSITLTGASSANPFNVTGTSTVQATPEPSTLALAGLGALGLIGYGLRRRKAMGA